MTDRHFELNDLNSPLIREFSDRMPGGYFIYRAEGDGELLYANRSVFEIFGCETEEEFRRLTGYTFRGMVHPEDYVEIYGSIEIQISKNDSRRDYVEYRICRKDGSVRRVYDYGSYDESSGCFYVFITDIAKTPIERIREDETREAVILQTLTRFYHTVWVIHDVETEKCSLYYVDTSDNTVRADAVRKSLINAKYSTARIKFVDTMVAPEDRERVRKDMSLESILEQLKDKDQFSLTFLRCYENGAASRYFRIDVGKLCVPGNRIGITMGFKDVDREFRAVQEAHDTKEENRRLLEQNETLMGLADLVDSVTSMLSNMPAMTFSKDGETGVYIACNKAFAEYAHKSSPDGVVGLTDFDIFDHDTAAHFVEDDRKALNMDKPYIFFEDVPNGDGSEIRNLQTTKVKFTDRFGRPCTMGMCVDITRMTQIKTAEAAALARQQVLEERLKLQEQLIREQRRREEQDRMITALASDYRSVYHVDLDSDDAVCFRSDPEAHDQHPEGVHFPYYENFASYAKKI